MLNFPKFENKSKSELSRDPVKPARKEEKEEDSEVDLERRDFLKKLVVAGGVLAAVELSGAKQALSFVEKKLDPKSENKVESLAGKIGVEMGNFNQFYLDYKSKNRIEDGSLYQENQDSISLDFDRNIKREWRKVRYLLQDASKQKNYSEVMDTIFSHPDSKNWDSFTKGKIFQSLFFREDSRGLVLAEKHLFAQEKYKELEDNACLKISLDILKLLREQRMAVDGKKFNPVSKMASRLFEGGLLKKLSSDSRRKFSDRYVRNVAEMSLTKTLNDRELMKPIIGRRCELNIFEDFLKKPQMMDEIPAEVRDEIVRKNVTIKNSFL